MVGADIVSVNFETNGNTTCPVRFAAVPATGTSGRFHPGRAVGKRPVASPRGPKNDIATLALSAGQQFPSARRSKSAHANAERKTGAQPHRGQSRTNAP